MKTLIVLFCIIFAFQINAQNEKTYELTRSMAIRNYDALKPDDTSGTKVTVQKGWQFIEDHKIKGGVIIRFLKWTNNQTRNENFYATYTTVDKTGFLSKKAKDVKEIVETKLFYISNEDFKFFTKELEKKEPGLSFVTGALTIPIKVRPGGKAVDTDGNKIRAFDFTGEVNIGLSVGGRIRISGTNDRLFFIPAVGVNLTSVSVDESTVRNAVINSNTKASSLSPFVGGIIEYDDFQVLLMTGWDHLSGRIGENWVYQGKPWFGLGLGYNIFNTKGGKPENKEQ